MGYMITMDSNRKLQPDYNVDIMDYYRVLVGNWNEFDGQTILPDGRTNPGKACRRFVDSLVYLYDVIIHTNAAHTRQIAELEDAVRGLQWELSKWTDQQTGRKPALTKEQHAQVKTMKAQGKSNRAIAAEFGVSEKTIRRSLKINLQTV